MTETLIRPLHAGDRAQWNTLWADYLTFYETVLAPEITDTLFERLLGDGNHDALVAERDGKLIGFVHYLPHPTTWSTAPTCYLEDLYIASTARGGGVGAKLINAVYEAAERAGCTNVYWHTHDDNTTARRLYDRIGVLSNFVRYDKRKWEDQR
ncbi:ribosomal protein S18 acetylase RimI-like enzyme [Roseibium hamelinense]|uniref:Ribosomal protein S18 acetylase RimI-like enzyme n=1 Tax=Roseibium hamelinense TaxID=150831 RepID=A0A562SFA6_9HYPH|nr:GNAT family N-acetyltransferase [Roseibium hamelinense]MTI44178.1 GNAT family N-acetyltransferase [Roseibium hamelinense]TWI80039.1 ribosomal protein S18 acetylase RimI-like enzyme [Roseibium hamelinense]